ncbi:NADH-ubiquinone oxidoreductase-F iron-sulfur binding region domain-containing protein [Halegenticoccus soli]|uniref:NADH-ubiquinone oxidoreductase-F iron-sulfur binding region domain-containing protein n=1 Tax=Halegenticoccus soli TaxID=1985678 RepID=UPI000C6DB925|nr:NADH-ubiquinone oxidoreductase-F iron-sulfur binding region domain-containing protein [Halegenticoccus soli]
MDSSDIDSDGPVARVCVGSGTPTARGVLSAARAAASSVPVVAVGSAGAAGLDPLVLLTRDGTTAFHAAPSPERAAALVSDLEDGGVPAEGADAVVAHAPDAATLPRPETGPLAVGRRRVLGPCGWADPTNSGALADGSAALIADREGDDALDRLSAAGLLGRGRGDGSTDEPVADQWKLAREAGGDPVVVVNAHEADPSAAGDGTLLEGATARVLDGALAVRALVGATDVVVYLNEADDLARERVGETVDSAVAAGAVDADEIDVVAGPDRDIAGEMTMALESMEGNDRLEARLRPPRPSEYGLYGRPTIIHTPRTLAQVRAALVDPDHLDPDDADPGTRLVTVAGDVGAPATVELSTGERLGNALDAVDRGGFKFASVGGRFGGLTRALDLPASAPALAASGLGTNGVVEVFGRDRCVVALVGARARFASEENCGRCVPCREGSKQLTNLLRGVYDGDYEAGRLRELARAMRETSVCEFGIEAQRPVATAVDEFGGEFRAHADGRCPSGECTTRRS